MVKRGEQGKGEDCINRTVVAAEVVCHITGRPCKDNNICQALMADKRFYYFAPSLFPSSAGMKAFNIKKAADLLEEKEALRIRLNTLSATYKDGRLGLCITDKTTIHVTKICSATPAVLEAAKAGMTARNKEIEVALKDLGVELPTRAEEMEE